MAFVPHAPFVPVIPNDDNMSPGRLKWAIIIAILIGIIVGILIIFMKLK